MNDDTYDHCEGKSKLSVESSYSTLASEHSTCFKTLHQLSFGFFNDTGCKVVVVFVVVVFIVIVVVVVVVGTLWTKQLYLCFSTTMDVNFTL